MSRVVTALVAAALLLPLTSCTGGEETQASDPELTVLAAASLTEAFTRMAGQLDGARVEASFGSSTDLAGQAVDGAPGDVLATADRASMQVAVDGGATAADPVPFASNELVIVTAPGNPQGITSLADLDGTTWVRCDDDVPCGRVALELVSGQEGEPASLEADVKATLEKVTSGEADAGLVYRSDAVAAGDRVATVDIEGSDRAATTYWIAPLAQASDTGTAQRFVDLVLSASGREILSEAGFTLP